VIEAAKPECEDPDDLVVVVLPVVVLLPVVAPPEAPLIPALPVAVPLVPLLLPVPVLLALLLAVPLVPVLLALPAPPAVPAADAVETWPFSAWVNVRLAVATCSWAVAMANCKAVLSKVARTWPAVTFSPMVTGTVETVPDTAKDTVAALEGSVVPVDCRVCKTECEPALAVTYVVAAPRVVA
jgi:hypothetical protein